MRNYLMLGGLTVIGCLILYGAGILDTPKKASAEPAEEMLPVVEGEAASLAPTFPQAGSTCFAYFDAVTVNGAASATVILGYPTEKAVLLSQYAIEHDDAALLARSQNVLSKVDAGARLRVVTKTASSVQGTVLNGSSLGETVFIPQDECHATAPTSIVQEAQ